MEFLSFQCVERFKTEGSISFALSTPVPSADLPAYLKSGRVNMVVGYLDFHYPASGHIRAYMRVVLKDDLAKGIEPDRFERAVLGFLHDRGLPPTITYEAFLVCFNEILSAENRVNAEGKTDGLW